MLNPDVLFGRSASRVKGCVGLPPGAEMQPGKPSLGGEELIDGWITTFAAGVWYRNEESEQYPGLREWGKRAGV